MVVDLLLLAAGEVHGFPGSIRNADSGDAVDSAEAADRVAVTLEGRCFPVVSADRKV